MRLGDGCVATILGGRLCSNRRFVIYDEYDRETLFVPSSSRSHLSPARRPRSPPPQTFFLKTSFPHPRSSFSGVVGSAREIGRGVVGEARWPVRPISLSPADEESVQKGGKGGEEGQAGA